MNKKEGNKTEIIGATLKEWIEKSQYTKAEVARILGVSPQYVNGLCQGKPIGKVMANKIANLFGLSEYYLLTGEGTLLMEHEEKEPANSCSENKDINVLLLQSRLEEMERTIAAMRETIDTLKSTIVDKNVLIDYLKREILIHSTESDMYMPDTRSNFIDSDAPQDQT